MINEAAIEDFESWSDDEPTVSSTTASASEELQLLATDVHSNVSRASTSAMVPSSGRSAVFTDGDTVTCSKQLDCMEYVNCEIQLVPLRFHRRITDLSSMAYQRVTMEVPTHRGRSSISLHDIQNAIQQLMQQGLHATQ